MAFSLHNKDNENKIYFKIELEMHPSFLNTEMRCAPQIFICTKFPLIPGNFSKFSRKTEEETVTGWRSLRNGVEILNASQIYGAWAHATVTQRIETSRIKCDLSLGVL